jgi:hypothetical protein
MFENAFGLKSKENYHKMQISLREGMTKKHLSCIEYLEKKSLIREYCSQSGADVKEKYNKMVKSYGAFLRVHSQFLTKFVLQPAKLYNP